MRNKGHHYLPTTIDPQNKLLPCTLFSVVLRWQIRRTEKEINEVAEGYSQDRMLQPQMRSQNLCCEQYGAIP